MEGGNLDNSTKHSFNTLVHSEEIVDDAQDEDFVPEASRSRRPDKNDRKARKSLSRSVYLNKN